MHMQTISTYIHLLYIYMFVLDIYMQTQLIPCEVGSMAITLLNRKLRHSTEFCYS